jgi:hypothetical protein
MLKIIREFVDLALFTYVLEKMGYHFRLSPSDSFLRIRYSKHIMNPTGFYIGYEYYWVDYGLVPNRTINKLILDKYPDHQYLVDIGSCEIIFSDGPTSEICQHNHGDNCNCDLYVSPWNNYGKIPPEIDDEWTDIECKILNTEVDWEFNSAVREWFIDDLDRIKSVSRETPDR